MKSEKNSKLGWQSKKLEMQRNAADGLFMKSSRLNYPVRFY